MKAKRRRYLILLLFSIAVRIFFYFFRFEGTLFEPVVKTDILSNMIFYGITIGLLKSLKERKWLIGLTWVTMFAGIPFSFIEWAQPEYLTLTRSLARFMIVVSFVFLIFDVCLFFTRKSPARIFFRILSAVMTLDYLLAVLRTPELKQEEYADFLA